MAKFPFPSEAMTSYFDMMQFITQEQSPTLPKDVFSPEFEEYCNLSLIKDPAARPAPQKLMVTMFNQETSFLKGALESTFDLREWTSQLDLK